jgi:hypothetical protein
VKVGAARALAPVVILAVFGLLVTGVIPASIWTWVATGLLWAALFVFVSTTPGWDEAVTPAGVRLGRPSVCLRTRGRKSR